MSTPDYYLLPDGTECRKFIQGMSYYLGTAFAYLWRAGHKPNEPMVKDLRKALDNIRFELERKECNGNGVPENFEYVTASIAEFAPLHRESKPILRGAMINILVGDSAEKTFYKTIYLNSAVTGLEELINSLEAQ